MPIFAFSSFLKFGPWILLGLALIGLFYYRSEYEAEKVARLKDVVKAQELVAFAKEKDALATKLLTDANAEVINKLRQQLSMRNNVIASATTTNVCGSSPSFIALFEGLKNRQLRDEVK